MREGWSRYIESTYGAGDSESAEESAERTAVPCKILRLWSLTASKRAWASDKILLIISIIPIILIITIILIILIIPYCRADKRIQQNTTLSFHSLPGVC